MLPLLRWCCWCVLFPHWHRMKEFLMVCRYVPCDSGLYMRFHKFSKWLLARTDILCNLKTIKDKKNKGPHHARGIRTLSFFSTVKPAVHANPSRKRSPRPHLSLFKRKRSCFAPDTAIGHTTTPTENDHQKRTIRKRSPEWSDLKNIENAVF